MEWDRSGFPLSWYHFMRKKNSDFRFIECLLYYFKKYYKSFIEKDVPMRNNDSFRTFHELLQKSMEKNADFVLLGIEIIGIITYSM